MNAPYVAAETSCTTSSSFVRHAVGSPSLIAGKVRGANRLRRERRQADDERDRRTRAAACRAAASPGGATNTATPIAGAASMPAMWFAYPSPHRYAIITSSAVGRRPVGLGRPPHGEPRHERDARERDGVHLFVHDRLVPHRERRRADHAPPSTPPTIRSQRDGSQLAQDVLGRPETTRPAATALDTRGEHVDARRDGRRDRQQREHTADDDEERIARRMRQPERVGRGDVFARVPHRRRRRHRQRDTARARTAATIAAAPYDGRSLVARPRDRRAHQRARWRAESSAQYATRGEARRSVIPPRARSANPATRRSRGQQVEKIFCL